jgi:hypothetical protein
MPRDARGRFNVHQLKGLVAMLGIEADSVNDGEGAGYDTDHRSIVGYIGTDQFGRQSSATKCQGACGGVTRYGSYGEVAVAQMSNDALTEKPGGAEDDNDAILCQGAFVPTLAISLKSPSPMLDASNSAAIACASMAARLAPSGRRQRRQRPCDVVAVLLMQHMTKCRLGCDRIPHALPRQRQIA